MTINKFSKTNHEKGQALLMTMMLVATVLTVFLSISFKSTTETQITKLEEESQKALAAAEAGIEAALKSDSGVTIGGDLSSDLSNYSGSAICSEDYDKNYFVSPLIQKDEEYTFYLADYPGLTNTYSGTINLYYGTQSSCNDISLEVSLIYDAGGDGKYDVTRWIADSSNMFGTNNGEIYNSTLISPEIFNGVSFKCNTSSINIIPANYPNPKLLIVRAFGKATQIAFKGQSSLPPQGKICEANANATNSTVTKKVTLFQSYPQLPADFFVTSF